MITPNSGDNFMSEPQGWLPTIGAVYITSRVAAPTPTGGGTGPRVPTDPAELANKDYVDNAGGIIANGSVANITVPANQWISLGSFGASDTYTIQGYMTIGSARTSFHTIIADFSVSGYISDKSKITKFQYAVVNGTTRELLIQVSTQQVFDVIKVMVTSTSRNAANPLNSLGNVYSAPSFGTVADLTNNVPYERP